MSSCCSSPFVQAEFSLWSRRCADALVWVQNTSWIVWIQKPARYSCDSTDCSLLSTANSHLALEMRHLVSLLALIHFFDNFREAGSGCRNISDETHRDDKGKCTLKIEDRNICGSVPASCGGPIKCAGSCFIFDDMNPVLVINGGGWWRLC